ncbi:MAG: hypothetical protein JO043_09785 [Candidatus Eremiobacteraeota bacterium]|nr:hypothetical protein [Candidatus Eremiobacteraeota bacterium]
MKALSVAFAVVLSSFVAPPFPHRAVAQFRERTVAAFPDGMGVGAPSGPLFFAGHAVFYGVSTGGIAPCSWYRCGTVYKLSLDKNGGVLTVLYNFQGGNDGESPAGSLAQDQHGVLYGTTGGGGSTACIGGCGTVFRLTPLGHGAYAKSTVYAFVGGSDGAWPSAGVTLSGGGLLFGTTSAGGGGACQHGCGTVFSLDLSGPIPQDRVLYRLQGNQAGATPFGGVVLDRKGNIYGTATNPGCCIGTVFELLRQHGTYSPQIIHEFHGSPDGATPYSGLAIDAAGALYGTTYFGGIVSRRCSAFGCGTVFKLAQTGGSGWVENVIFRFDGYSGKYPSAPLLVGHSGTLYGTTEGGGRQCEPQDWYGCGVVFALVPSRSGYTENVLYRFRGNADGETPQGGLTPVPSVGLFGTTTLRSTYDEGAAFEIPL